MISRAQRILFFVMLIAAVTMAAILIRLREHAQDRLYRAQTAMPLVDAVDAPATTITLLVPNDADGSLLESQRDLPLPGDENARARIILSTLLNSYRAPHSTHPMGGASQAADSGAPDSDTPGIDEVFLMPIPQNPIPQNPISQSPISQSKTGKMAVVNFSPSFGQMHPSGIEPETLTLLSIIGTLHANFPEVTEVRFLVDGHQADTLAGHADLTRVYMAGDSATEGGQ